MNITKDYIDYISTKNNISPQFAFKYEKYSPIHKCNLILKQIMEAERNISQISTMSKKSSAFNDIHLKFTNASNSVKSSLMEIEKNLKAFKSEELNKQKDKSCKQTLINNCFDMLNSRASDLTMKFQKFLQNQAELIKKVEERKNNLSLSSKVNKNAVNEFVNLTNEKEEDDDVLLNVKIQEKKNDKYYQERLSGAQLIEKIMGDLSQMMKRMSQMTYNQSLMIDNISKNTDVAYDNIEKGANEVKKMYDDVKSNRKLLIKIFLIIIVTAVIYILLFA